MPLSDSALDTSPFAKGPLRIQGEASAAALFAAKVVIVGGPGGSGTGVVAQGMQLSGVNFGPPDGLGPPDAGHPKGKFQNLRIEKFHNNVLAELGCEKFTHPNAEQLVAYARSDRYLSELSAILAQFAGSPIFGWKCPVTGGLLPLWKRALAQTGYRLSNVYFINCVRDERCVALSLRKLGVGFETLSDQDLLEFIREDQSRTYENIGQDIHHLIVPFESLIKNPVDEIARLALILGLPDIPEAQIRELVDATIPRHSIPASRTGNDVLEIFRQFRKGGVL